MLDIQRADVISAVKSGSLRCRRRQLRGLDFISTVDAITAANAFPGGLQCDKPVVAIGHRISLYTMIEYTRHKDVCRKLLII